MTRASHLLHCYPRYQLDLFSITSYNESSLQLSNYDTMDVSWLSLAPLLLVCSILVSKMVVQRFRLVRPLRSIPCPTALPMIGNAVQLHCSLEEFFSRLLKWGRQFGDMYLLWVGSRPFIFLYRVESVQPLLTSHQHIDKSLEYQFLKPWLGTGLITSTGEKWHTRRKMLTPTFHSDLLKEYFKIALRESQTFVSCLRSEIGNPGFDIVPYAKRAALDVICECAMGYSVNAQVDIGNKYVMAVHRIAAIAQMRFTNIWIKLDSIFKLTSLGREHDKALKVIHDFVEGMIAKRRQERAETILKSPPMHQATPTIATVDPEATVMTTMKRKPQALLDLLLEISSVEGEAHLTDADIRDEVNTFMFAGHDSVGMSVSWALYALGRKPEYQEKILQEYKEVVGLGELTYEALSKLVWLEACIKETWRLYPTTPLIARQIYSPITLQGHEIPVGSTVLVNSYMLHRDPRHFPQPESYQPERFLPSSPRLPSFAYIPFSAGSRNCIGSKFALNELKIMLLSLLRAYSFVSLDAEHQLRPVSQLVLDNIGGIRVSIAPRQQPTLS